VRPFLLFAAALIAAVCTACTSPSPPASLTPTALATRPVPTPTATVAYKLATIQSNELPPDLLVNQFNHELTKLSAVCAQSEISLSDKTVTAHNILFKQGVDVPYLRILQDLNAIVSGFPPPVACDDVISAYVYMRAQ
jgi:hypothetical protein